MVYPEYVIKRDGSPAKFDPERIKYAMKRAMLAVNKYDEKKLNEILEYVLKVIEEKYDGKQNPKVEEIQDIVELALMKFDEYEVAKAYITYRKEKERIRREKIAILGEFYDEKVAKKFSLNSIRLMANRYLLKNEDGSLKEGPKQMFERVAMLVVIPDILHDPRVFDKDGKQNVWETEKFDAERYENKIGIGKISEDEYKMYWNRYHLERMKALYDELNKQGKMKISWREFFKKLENGEFDEYYNKFLEYFELMVSKKFMPNSPTLFNAGARLGQLSACFVLDIEDDMGSIMETAKEAAIIFKSGGGIGINYSKLRPEGDIVASTTGVASGPVSFMKIIDTVTDVVKQGGKRRGANMGILEVWHPDIEKFIHVKETEGVLENFNISVMITPEFWEYYEKNEDFPLVNPRNGKVWSTINPRKFFSELAYIAWKSADPGVLFMDNINKRNVMKHSKGMIRSTNPCVTGDTLILTDNGLVRANELKPGMFVWTPKGWNEIEEVYNNGVKDVYEVELANGLKIKVTKEHKFLTKNGWKKIEDIKEGEEIRIVLESPEDYIKANSINEQFAEFMGYWVGDGSLSLSNHVRLHVGNDGHLAKYFNSILSDLSGHSFIANDGNQFVVDAHRKEFANRLREIFGINVSRSYEKDIPDIILKSNKKTQAAFLRGLFSADGSVYDANGSITISLSSTSKELLEKVQILLLSLGIFSTLTDEKNEEEKTIKEGTYRTRKTYRIIINGMNAYKFASEIGLLGRKNNKLKQLLKNHSFYRKEKKFVKIKSIKHVGKDVVYDIKATPTYTWTTNGIYSYDCGEEPLYPYESCNLGSINLYAFIKEDEQHNRYFDWKDFERAIRIAYRFLDNVIDVNKYPLEKIERQTKAHRKIGLGLMGLADMFFALKVPYNSEEGFELMKKVAEFLTYHAMDESVNRAMERGTFPDYELSGYKNGEMPLEGFYHKEEWNLDWERLRRRIMENGIRNLEVTTIAPTGSISMLSDTSSGIEPQFALVFEKRVVAGEYYYVDEELKRQLIENSLWNEEILKKISNNGGSLQGIKEIPEDLRKVFVTAMDIPWWDHVRAQAVLQLWITTSISKTINMPSWIEPEDVEKAYLFAYRTGCKGITIYRDGSKSRQVIYIPGEKQKSRIFEVMELVKNKTLAIMDAMGIKPPRWLFQEVRKTSNEVEEQKTLPKLNLKITMDKIESEAKSIGKERCPVCGNEKLIYQSGCVTCPQCGWSECVIA
ncbi:MAG: adenosylcobalamin-dependent ribonucleoside-diphosphate reductase [Candidatus Aenigmarchaeota archaeon]|nr:adenosylcobalamin-dependent ribonucleoside-diphosphate reductase [Candidatus Aenigmarchaeota archaeon]